MKYSKEYQEYIKKITDMFIKRLSHDSSIPIEEQYVPSYERVNGEIKIKYSVNEENIFTVIDCEIVDEYDKPSRAPKDVVEAWWKIENEVAVKWLQKNMVTYDEWLKKYK